MEIEKYKIPWFGNNGTKEETEALEGETHKNKNQIPFIKYYYRITTPQEGKRSPQMTTKVKSNTTLY